ncbi:ABC transporter substrate-binding protein [Sporosarcina limicola]|uniref:Peptide/nickel transport system substrate-binding protein n=1 Tax=Sporosarcina limicola TaxID=34101 RepID=A0A927MG20_9BACL|nr:ABC transporter substrate-binding protein [Sporosarcina limicola]MBE1553925.1 peptide/nickel transport system substrate-binding protein [Sporosarcina limicola]
MKKHLIKIFPLIGLALLLILSACTKNDADSSKTPASPNSASGEKIVSVGIVNPISSINPINTADVGSREVINLLFDSLYDVNEELEFIPKLAKEFKSDDNQTFTITIEPEANWTDGKPVSSEDILFTLNTMANPDVHSLGLPSLSVIEGLDDDGRLPEGEESITGFEIIDEKTFSVKTKNPIDPNILKENLGYLINIIPKHVLKDIDPDKLHLDPFMENPTVTSGPLTLVKLANDSYVEFKANPDYYRGAPKIDKLIIKIMPSSNLVAQLQTGEIQMVHPGVGAIPVQDFEKVRSIEGIKTIQGKPFDYQTMFFNMNVFDDASVRLAIVHAINRPMLVDTLLQGEAEIVNSSFTTIHPYYNQDIEIYEYDPEKSKKLLKDANWDLSKPINLAVPVGNQIREQAAAIIAENLKAVGFKVEINKYDFPTLMQKGKNHDFDLLMMGMPLRVDPNRSSNILHEKGGMINYSDYDNPKINQLFADGKSEDDPAKRKIIFNELQEILNVDLPIITLFSAYSFKPVSDKMIVGEPKSMGMFYDVHEWDIK